jgi:rubrerythrin
MKSDHPEPLMDDQRLAQLIRNGIEVEYAAEHFYDRLVTATSDEPTRRFLITMAEQERLHAQDIERAGRVLVGKLPTNADASVETVEACPEWSLAEDIDFHAALKLAVDNEVHAALFYDAIASDLEGEGKEFFTHLARQEDEHARQLKEILAEYERHHTA